MRPTEVLCEVRKLYKKGSVAARTLAVLNPLPKYFKHRRGGRVPQRSLSGVYHGAVISTGTLINTNNKDHTFYSSRRFKPNVKRMVHHSEVLGAGFTMQTTTKALREIKRYGGFDNYLLNAPPHLLSTETTRLRDTIRSSLHAYLDLGRSSMAPLPDPSSASADHLADSSSPSSLDPLAIADGSSSSDPSTALTDGSLSSDSSTAITTSSSSSDPSIALATLSLSDDTHSPPSVADAVEIELPKGISARPHALDRIRPRALREGDRLRKERKLADRLKNETAAATPSS